jgi:hypothetical protein
VKSTHCYEFATNPAAVTCNDGEVIVEDWLIQPIAADGVADVLVEAALGQTHVPRTITGPAAMRLPDLTSNCLPGRATAVACAPCNPSWPDSPREHCWLPMAPASPAPTSKLGCTLAPTRTDGSPAADESKRPVGDG